MNIKRFLLLLAGTLALVPTTALGAGFLTPPEGFPYILELLTVGALLTIAGAELATPHRDI